MLRLSLVAMLACLVGLAGCKKKIDPTTPTVAGPPVNPVEVALQIAAITPSTIEALVPSTIEVIGAGFQPGASVRVGGTFASNVAVQDTNMLRAALPPMTVGVYDLAVQNPDANEAVRRGGVVVRAAGVSVDMQRCGSVLLYFATDAAGLDSAARSRLDGVMDCYLSTVGPIQVDGHADVRGTTDYNLALGQRRAETVQQVMVGAGVPRSRIPVMSFGEERPAASGSGEGAWAQNRRVQLTLIQP